MIARPLVKNKRVEATGTFLANLTCTAVVQVPPGPAWELKQITIHTSFLSPIVKATSFVGTNSAGVRISNALYGNDDTDSIPNTTVRYGESVCVVWTGGTAGQTGTMTVIYDEVDY